MSSQINVYFRKKPFTELLTNDQDIIRTRGNTIYVKNLKPRVSNKSHYMEYNGTLLNHELNNEDIYNKTIRADVINNNNILLMAYGQTGSGKTHTLCGGKTEDGIIPLVIKKMLRRGKICHAKVLEVYRDNIYDILSPNKPQLFFYEVNKRIKYRQEPVTETISTIGDFDRIIRLVSKNKRMGTTKINQTSSRSHTIFYFIIDNKQKFIAIDLAGNERGYLTGAKNSLENKEYIAINQSLFALKECIRGVFFNRPYIPFRRSKLTILLRDLLNKSLIIHFIGTLNPSVMCYPDIIDTIEYGSCLKRSKLKNILKHTPSEVFIKLPSIIETNYTLDKTTLTPARPATCAEDKPSNRAYTRDIKSEPALTNTDQFLKKYHEFIINNYLLARKHVKIYKSLSGKKMKIPVRKIKQLLHKYTQSAEFIVN